MRRESIICHIQSVSRSFDVFQLNINAKMSNIRETPCNQYAILYEGIYIIMLLCTHRYNLLFKLSPAHLYIVYRDRLPFLSNSRVLCATTLLNP